MDTLSTFSDSLNEIMTLHGLNVKQVSEIAKVSLTTVYTWLKGRDIKLSNLMRLAEHFKLRLDYFIAPNETQGMVTGQPAENFGKRLREVMEERGVSTYKLRTLGYGSCHFKNWDKGADPYLSTLFSLSRILECPIDYLVGRS